MTTRPRPRRFSASLGTRIFLVTALLLLLAVGSAVVVTYLLGNRIASEAVSEALARSAVAQRSLRELSENRLELLSQSMTDPALTAYFVRALEEDDSDSILNLLEERQGQLGFDFAVALDPDGRVVARTDRPGAVGDDLAGQALVARALEEYYASGIWNEGTLLYQAAAVPLQEEFDLVGFLVIGFRIDDVQAIEVSRSSGTEVAYLAGPPGEWALAATTLGASPSDELMSALAARRASGAEAADAAEGERFDVVLEGRPWAALLTPLVDPNGERVGASVSLASLDARLAPYRQILTVLAAAGLLSIVAGLVLSYALSRRTLGPVRRLVAVAESARAGDYDQEVPVERADEIGRLASAFDDLLRELREKRDMEVYVSELARNLPEPGLEAGQAPPATVHQTLLAVELRRFSSRDATADADQALELLARDLRRVRSAARSAGGRLVAALGHRALAIFDGDESARRAFAAATEVLAVLGSRQDAFDEPSPPLVALARGDLAVGSVVLGETSSAAVVGMAVQKIEGLLREATPGEILLASEVYDDLAKLFEDRGVVLTRGRGVVTPLPLYVVRADQAERLADAVAVVRDEPTRLLDRPTIVGLTPGSLFGNRFEILSTLGSGGMGVVFRARDRELDEIVALKMLREEAWASPVEIARFKAELKLARRVTHPNVVRLYDFGEIDGKPFLSMEYVRGITLRTLMDQTERLPYAAGLRVAKQLCAGLEAAHAEGVIHRDIKPENLILETNGNAKLMDFGIARPLDDAAAGVTRAGFVVGTPQYLSPEQLEGATVDHRADLYATGIVLYEIFTGRLPVVGKSSAEIVRFHLTGTPVPPSEHWPEIPAALERLILDCLEKKPEARLGSAAELLAGLEKLRG